jgi:hypothetical protein
LRILDTRPVAPQRRRLLEGLERRLYLACDQARNLKSCAELAEVPTEQAAPVLDALCRDRLMLALDDGRYLALAVAGELPRLLRPEEFPGGACKVAPGLI